MMKKGKKQKKRKRYGFKIFQVEKLKILTYAYDDRIYLFKTNPEKFPGFDQANRIRGGLKSGGSTCK